ncbi:MAG: hypothetical protein NTZ08_09715 [Verrucomicrobia bacterium]|nr:hypothetical protein [Verrucomicrobiota bacterium]
MEERQSMYARRYDREFKENAMALVESGIDYLGTQKQLCRQFQNRSRIGDRIGFGGLPTHFILEALGGLRL